MLIVCFLLPLIPVSTQAGQTAENGLAGYAQAQANLHAVGKLRLQAQRIQRTLNLCADRYQHLRESASEALHQWQLTNQPILDKTSRVSETVLQNVRQLNSPFAAEKLALEIDTLISSQVTTFEQDFSQKPRKQQHYLCNRLILSISTGEHDLANTTPAATRLIMEYK